METLLITGASGFLGKIVINQLEKSGKYKIVAVTSGRKKQEFSSNIQIETANLLIKPEEIIESNKPNILLHLAWGKQDGSARNSESNIEWLEVSCKLLRAFVANGGRRFIFAGTSSEYEEENGLRQETEKSFLRSMYGETKKAFSSIAKNYCQRTGVEFVDSRIFTLFGEDDQHELGAIPLCIRTLMKGEKFVCKAPNTIRDYVYVRDAAKAIEMIIASNYCGSVNISSGQPRAMRDVFYFIANELKKEKLLLFDNENRCDLILVGDNKILLQEIGFSGFTDFEDNMRKTISWWKNH